jgi:hypothetical protein
MIKISLFQNSKSVDALPTTFEEFILNIRTGKWQKQVEKARYHKSKNNDAGFKAIKKNLPAVTISGQFRTRSAQLPMDKRLISHSGLICIDIDFVDNPDLNVNTVVDKECIAQFVSCSGKGIKIIYKCAKTKDVETHSRIYAAAVKRLESKNFRIKPDPQVSFINALQYVSYDPELFYRPKNNLTLKPLPIPKKVKPPVNKETPKLIAELEDYIAHLKGIDATADYNDWIDILFGLSHDLGEQGRYYFHELSKHHANYNAEECETMYTYQLQKNATQPPDDPIRMATVYGILNKALPKVTARKLTAKYLPSHIVGEGKEVEQGDLAGMVSYKLFLFKKIFESKGNDTVADLKLQDINLNALEELLVLNGFYRYGELGTEHVRYVRITNNIVKRVDIFDILHTITELIRQEGSYEFTYNGNKFEFHYTELTHLWKKLLAPSSMQNQIAASLRLWEPNLLKDTATESYVPYLNGVVRVSATEIRLLPYKELAVQIWADRILSRDYKYVKEVGMFEEFFANVCGRGSTRKERIATEEYKRATWYFGYMLQGVKRQSTARAVLLYDTKPGNNGRTGKSIIGQAVGKIRSMVTLDGKNTDLRNNRFLLQTVMPWTEVVFIDDPSKYTSLIPLFNMITGEASAERKGKDPISKSLKFIIASNWILEAEGTSEQGRQFVAQLDDYYVRYAKANADTIQPLVHHHGKEFFTDWDATDWQRFDSFCMRALKYHLSIPPPKDTIMGNSKAIRFQQVHEKELFHELCTTFANNVKRSKSGGLLVPQKVLMNVIRDSDPKIGSGIAGRLCREFLSSIGAKDITITSMTVGSLVQMGYMMESKWEDLKFGEVSKSITTPKGLTNYHDWKQKYGKK